MKHLHTIFLLVAMIFISSLTTTGFEAFIPTAVQSRSTERSGNPDALTAETRQQIEEQILGATVRIEIDSWAVQEDVTGYDFDILYSHATVMDGRYLVTHNHFGSLFSGQVNSGERPRYRSVTLSDVYGVPLFRGPLSEFEIVWEDAETLVIGHKDETLFGRLGLDSAEFGVGTAVSLAPGMEVAQIDWDGTTTWVEWHRIEAVEVEDGVAVLVLDGDIMVGASGGGVFWQGVHVANNWTVRQVVDGDGVVVGRTTKVALNSGAVVGNNG